MSNYTIQVDWAGKDDLSDSDPEKIISGDDFDTEFQAVRTAVNSKADLNGSSVESFSTNDLTVNGNLVVNKFLGYADTVAAVSGTTPSIVATNGTILTWTLSGNSTPTDGLLDGQSVLLMIDDGSAYTITWTSLVDQWKGGSAPTLATSGYTVVGIWKVGSTVYGSYIGDMS